MIERLPVVWRGHVRGRTHAFYDDVPGVAERIVVARVEASTGVEQRRSRCGAWAKLADLTTGNGGRRCKVCERAVAKSKPAPWVDEAVRPEQPSQTACSSFTPEMLASRLVGASYHELVHAFEVDRRATLEGAAAIARDVAREHATRIEGSDYFRAALEQAAVAAALDVAGRLERASKPRRVPLRLVHDAARVA